MSDQTPIGKVLEQHSPRLMAVEGVEGVGQGECDGVPCIKVLVSADPEALADKLPASLEGYAVEVVYSGKIEARE